MAQMTAEAITKQKVNFLLDKLGLELNDMQKELVTPSDRLKMGVAGAGAGKTTALVTASITEEVVKGVPGDRIYCITFTRKAAREFKARHKNLLYRLDRSFSSDANISTIHSLCLRYVTLFKEHLGIPEVSLMESDSDLRDLCKQTLAVVLERDENKILPKLVEETVSLVQLMDNKMFFTEKEVSSTYEFLTNELTYEQFEIVRSVMLSTQRRSGFMHIETTQTLFYELLKQQEQVRVEIQNLIQSIFVDEFQDTTMLQLEILDLLRGPNTVLTVVGDPDQSIYRWRGACDAFPITMKRYPDHQLIIMDINYRSADFVIQAANALIRNNIGRIPSVIKGTGKKGRLEIIPVSSNQQASLEIGNLIANEYISSGRDNYTLLNKLVLYRNHSQAMFLVYDLASKDIPVVITERKILPHNDKIVRDILSIITWLDNPNNSQLTSAHMFMVSSQVSKPKDKEKCPYYTSDEKTHFADIPVTVKDVNKYTEEIQQLIAISKLIRDKAPHRKIFELILPLYMGNYYKRFRINIYMGKTDEDVNGIERFLLTGFNPEYDMDGVRYVLTKVEQFVNQSAKEGIGIPIFSIHNAKGLEADSVYLLDWNGQQQPNPNIIEVLMENKSYRAVLDFISEERSLAFVAITRAKYNLIATYRTDNPSPFNYESALNEKMRASKNIIAVEKFALEQLWKNGESYGLSTPPKQEDIVIPDTVKPHIDKLNGIDPNATNALRNLTQSAPTQSNKKATLTEQDLLNMAQGVASKGPAIEERTLQPKERAFDI